jgi:hypothetical protein
MRVELEVFENGRATLTASSVWDEGEYWRTVDPDEVINGKAVCDYEPGVYELDEIPPDPGNW